MIILSRGGSGSSGYPPTPISSAVLASASLSLSLFSPLPPLFSLGISGVRGYFERWFREKQSPGEQKKGAE